MGIEGKTRKSEKELQLIISLFVWSFLILFKIIKTLITGFISFISNIFLYFSNQVNNQKYNFTGFKPSIDQIDRLSGYEFEEFVIDYLKFHGYTNIEGTKYTGDFGVDIIGYKEKQKCAIQCKRFKNNVNLKAVQEVSAGRQHYNCDKAIVITNSYFTNSAKDLASSNNVQLIDRDDLIKYFNKVNFIANFSTISNRTNLNEGNNSKSNVKVLITIISIIIVIFVSNDHSKSNIDTIVSNDSPNSENQEALNKYFVEIYFNTPVPLNTKQFVRAKDGTKIILTDEGVVYIASEYSSEFVEWEATRNKYVDWIYSDSNLTGFLIDGDFYDANFSNIGGIEISEYTDLMISLKNKSSVNLFYGKSYINDNILFKYDSESKEYKQLEIVGLQKDEIIKMFFHSNVVGTIIVTDKAIYKLCNDGSCYSRDQKLTEIFLDLNNNVVYFDGATAIDKNGIVYYLEINYWKY